MNRLSLRAAIDAKCKSCIYDPGSGNGAWREQVEACTSSNCPLHPLRPVSGAFRRERGDDGTGTRQATVSRLYGPKNGLPGLLAAQTERGAA